MVQEAVKARDDLRVILMAATVQVAKFQAYFGGRVPLLNVPGRQYQVTDRYLSLNRDVRLDRTQHSSSQNFIQHTPRETNYDNDSAGVFIFEYREPEIQRGMGMLVAASASLEVIPLYGALSKSQHQRIYQDVDVRRCILSTNIAEISLTIPNIVYVIDLGLAKEMVWNPRVRVNELRRATISKFSAK
ncbi:hypothetical protein LQW54_001391 [Pestalotiopsis sp. IQ-011]